MPRYLESEHIFFLSFVVYAENRPDSQAEIAYANGDAEMDAMKLTVEQITTDHYLPEKRKRRRTNTVDGYESSIGLYVIPQWGDMAISQIGRDDVQDWVERLAGTKAGPRRCLESLQVPAPNHPLGHEQVGPVRGRPDIGHRETAKARLQARSAHAPAPEEAHPRIRRMPSRSRR